jgi:hypothetical protein
VVVAAAAAVVVMVVVVGVVVCAGRHFASLYECMCAQRAWGFCACVFSSVHACGAQSRWCVAASLRLCLGSSLTSAITRSILPPAHSGTQTGSPSAHC